MSTASSIQPAIQSQKLAERARKSKPQRKAATPLPTTCLVIDDDPRRLARVANCVADVLSTPMISHGAKAGLRDIKASLPDLIAMPVMMQEYSGLELVAKLRRIAGCEHTRVLLLGPKVPLQDKLVSFAPTAAQRKQLVDALTR